MTARITGGGLTDKTHTPDGYCPPIANPLTARMHKGINTTLDEGQTPIVTSGGVFDEAVAFEPRYYARGQGGGKGSDIVGALSAEFVGFSDKAPHVFSAMPMNSGKDYTVRETEIAQPLSTVQAGNHNQGGDFIQQATAVRRLTPRECERLQGFPDDYTQVPWRGREPSQCPDGPRYKALGNSMAVPVIRWIGERIQMFESLDLAA